MNEPININEASFEKAVIKSPIPVLVDFWAPGAIPCKMIGPLLDEVAKESGDRFRIAKVNIDDESDPRPAFQRHAVPPLLFFSGEKLRDQLVGGAPQESDHRETRSTGHHPGFHREKQLNPRRAICSERSHQPKHIMPNKQNISRPGS